MGGLLFVTASSVMVRGTGILIPVSLVIPATALWILHHQSPNHHVVACHSRSNPSTIVAPLGAILCHATVRIIWHRILHVGRRSQFQRLCTASQQIPIFRVHACLSLFYDKTGVIPMAIRSQIQNQSLIFSLHNRQVLFLRRLWCPTILMPRPFCAEFLWSRPSLFFVFFFNSFLRCF